MQWVEYNWSGFPVGKILLCLALLAAAHVVRYVFEAASERWLRHRGWLPKDLLIRAHFRPTIFLALASGLTYLALPLLGLKERTYDAVAHLCGILFIFSLTWS